MDNFQIERKTYQYFIRVMKEKGLYTKVPKIFKNGNKDSNVDMSVRYLSGIFKSEKQMVNIHNKYDEVVFFTNSLLSFYLTEYINIHFNDNIILQECGQEIFDLTCRSLFSNTFESDMKRLSKKRRVC